MNAIINFLSKFSHKIKMVASMSVFSLGLSLFLYQINTRPIDFSYTGHTNKYDKFEAQSKEIQKEILGDTMFEFMTSINNNIPLNF